MHVTRVSRRHRPSTFPNAGVGGAHVAGAGSTIVFGVGAAVGTVLMLSGYVMTGAFVMLGGMLSGSLIEQSTSV